VAALERRLEAVDARSAVRGREETPLASPRPVPPLPATGRAWQAVAPVPTPSARVSRPTIAVLPADPGQWVNRLGIALLLFGAAFGFKYSIDRGWIGPAVRVLSGLGLGVVLLGASARLRNVRPGLSRVLAGGGIACAYLSVYAAFQLYLLISHGAAFAAMSVVTVVAFAVAVRSDDAMAATIGTLGGLATPFLLHTNGGNVPGLVGYTCLVVSGAGAVFAKCGWRVLLWTTVMGGWALLAAAAEGAGRGAGSDALVVQVGILFLALATWWLCVVREMLCAEDPSRWRPTTAGLGVRFEPSLFGRDTDWSQQPHQLTLATPVLVLLVSTWTWELEQTPSGWIALSLATGWSMAALHLRSMPFEAARRLAATHAMAAAVMVAFAMSFLLGNDACRVGFAAEALAVLVLASRSDNRQPATLGHLLFALVSLQTLQRLVEAINDGKAGLHAAEFADLAVIAGLAAAASVQSSPGRVAYFFAAQSGLLLWLLRVLDPLANGAAFVTAAWFTNAVVLVVAGLRLDSAALRTAGAAVMALTMGKLFVVDLATVDAAWRVVTFLAFGAVLLGLGYAFPALWKREREATSGDT